MSLLILIFSSLTYAGSMSTVDLIVREAASNEFGGVYYDDWVLTSAQPHPGCLMTVKAQVNFLYKDEITTIEGLYCITRNKNSSFSVSRIEPD